MYIEDELRYHVVEGKTIYDMDGKTYIVTNKIFFDG
jgi:hypothetical protein